LAIGTEAAAAAAPLAEALQQVRVSRTRLR
jgi:hypothetical protein